MKQVCKPTIVILSALASQVLS